MRLQSLKRLEDGPWVWAAAVAAFCLFSGIGAAWLGASGVAPASIAAWLGGSAALGLGLTRVAFRRWAAHADLIRLAQRILYRLDDQEQSLHLEQQQIDLLQATIADKAMRRGLSMQLDQHMQPNLVALIGQLQEAEEAVPEAAAVTRSWLQRACNLADQTRMRLERVQEDLDGG
jgi:hypothetical protein